MRITGRPKRVVLRDISGIHHPVMRCQDEGRESRRNGEIPVRKSAGNRAKSATRESGGSGKFRAGTENHGLPNRRNALHSAVMNVSGSQENRTGSAFPATPWTMLGISSGNNTAARRALDRVCCLYWAPLYAFLRRSGHGAAESEDLTQGFFAHLLEKGVLGKADAEKGRLRSFLIGTLKHFLRDETRKQATQKRGSGLMAGGDPALLEEQLAQTGVSGETPDEAYERRWAVSLLGHALAQLKEEEIRAGRGAAFEVLSEYLVRSSGARPQSEAAAQLGITENALGVAVHRLRKRFQAVFRAQVAATVGAEDQVEDEIQHLRALFLKG